MCRRVVRAHSRVFLVLGAPRNVVILFIICGGICISRRNGCMRRTPNVLSEFQRSQNEKLKSGRGDGDRMQCGGIAIDIGPSHFLNGERTRPHLLISTWARSRSLSRLQFDARRSLSFKPETRTPSDESSRILRIAIALRRQLEAKKTLGNFPFLFNEFQKRNIY